MSAWVAMAGAAPNVHGFPQPFLGYCWHMETRVRAAARWPLRCVRRLSRWQIAFLLPCAGLVFALLLHLAQWVTSWVSTSMAHAHGAADACSDLVNDFGADLDSVELVDRAPFGYTCLAEINDGSSTMIEYSGATSAMFVVSAGLAALGLAAFVGVMLAFTASRLIRGSRSPLTEGAAGRWGLVLITVGVFVLPLMLLGQYLQWYGASKSGGSGICPDVIGGDEVLGFSVTADYLPPSLTCSGDTVAGQDFSVTEHGFPFYGFLAGLVLAAVGLVVLFVVRVRTRQR